jgi:hypothetical protein
MLAPNRDYVDLSKPSIAGLAYALRHQEVWPEGFRWYFPDCKRCAIGLAWALWGDAVGRSSPDVMVSLGIASNAHEAIECKDREIFFSCLGEGRLGARLPSPEDIAERLEALLA